MKMRSEIPYKLSGLEYVFLKNVSVEKTKQGEIILNKLEAIEQAVAKEIISSFVPLRGAEVHFLRKVIGLSLEGLAEKFNLTAPAIFKWEKEHRNDRLSVSNEVSARIVFAELLDVQINPGFEIHLSKTHTPERLEVDLSKAKTETRHSSRSQKAAM